MDLIEIGVQAKQASRYAARLTESEKNDALIAASNGLKNSIEQIVKANESDVAAAEKDGRNAAFIDRLKLNESRIHSMASGLEKVVALKDPIGEVLYMKKLPNGLTVGNKRVPLGVIGIIYESRPNVTSDAFGLCLKSGNSVILKGGKESIKSNEAIVNAIQAALEKAGFNKNVLQLITDNRRETVVDMMRLNKYINVLIPRGSASLIQSVIQNSTVPVIETGVGNCHIFVDKHADFEMAKNIIINAKTQRTGVCNACEKLLIHRDIAESFTPIICNALNEKNVDIVADDTVCSMAPNATAATEDDWHTEFLDLKIGVKVVDNIHAAISHIEQYGSGHSEVIVTESYSNSQLFLDEVDAAAVYVNASSRFTDGEEFGFGAEIGISTQKLHARGPMGLNELTSTKYIVYGSGQIRA